MVLIAMIGSGGLVTLIQAAVNKRRNRSEVSTINIKNAMEIEEKAVMRYTEMDAKLKAMEATVEGLKKDLAAQRAYIQALHDVLNRHNIEVPEMREGR